MRTRPVVYIAFVAGAVVAVAAIGQRSNLSRVDAIASLGATKLGLDIANFKGPTNTGSSVFGSDTYIWERSIKGQPVERLAYLQAEDRLCWSVSIGDGWKDNGCINTQALAK